MQPTATPPRSEGSASPSKTHALSPETAAIASEPKRRRTGFIAPPRVLPPDATAAIDESVKQRRRGNEDAIRSASQGSSSKRSNRQR